jgi:hypothetical protein
MEIICHIFKLATFSKFFGDLMSHIIMEYADEEMKYFLYILPLKIMDILLSVFLVSGLYENMKKLASKVAEQAQIQPKSQFLFHKNLPPHDFSIMTLALSK